MNEHYIQKSMVDWFRIQYPKLEKNLFSVPNGTNKSKKQASYMRAEGLTPGVSDLILVYEEVVYFIEVKTPTGKMSSDQKVFKEMVVKNGFNYYLVRSLDDFRKIVTAII